MCPADAPCSGDDMAIKLCRETRALWRGASQLEVYHEVSSLWRNPWSSTKFYGMCEDLSGGDDFFCGEIVDQVIMENRLDRNVEVLSRGLAYRFILEGDEG